MTSADENGDYNVYINEALSNEKKEDALNHELSHILNDDFNSDKPIEQIENNAKRCEKTQYLAHKKKGYTNA